MNRAAETGVLLPPPYVPPSLLQRVLRSQLIARLRRLRCGSIVLTDGLGRVPLGEVALEERGGQVVLQVLDWRPGGLELLQAITIEDHRYARAVRTVDFIKRCIFPGSFIPSVTAMLSVKTRVCDLALIDLQDFGASYARTLQAWRARFLAQRPQVRAMGFDEGFVRLWQYYLAYCEGAFRERVIGAAHLLLRKPDMPVYMPVRSTSRLSS